MSKLVERMKKKNAPKTWIREVEQMEHKREKLEELIEEYSSIIDTLARQLERENQEFDEYLARGE